MREMLRLIEKEHTGLTDLKEKLKSGRGCNEILTDSWLLESL
jgi:hypothetical protein